MDRCTLRQNMSFQMDRHFRTHRSENRSRRCCSRSHPCSKNSPRSRGHIRTSPTNTLRWRRRRHRTHCSGHNRCSGQCRRPWLFLGSKALPPRRDYHHHTGTPRTTPDGRRRHNRAHQRHSTPRHNTHRPMNTPPHCHTHRAMTHTSLRGCMRCHNRHTSRRWRSGLRTLGLGSTSRQRRRHTRGPAFQQVGHTHITPLGTLRPHHKLVRKLRSGPYHQQG